MPSAACGGRRADRGATGLGHILGTADVEAQVPDQAILQSVDPAVYLDRLTAAPGLTDHRRLTDIHRLLEDVEFAEPVGAQLRRRLRRKVAFVAAGDVLHMPEPVVDQAERALRGGRLDA